MANTYFIRESAIAFSNAAAKSILSVFNASGSGRILRVYRVWLTNSSISNVAAVLSFLEVRRITAQSSGSAVTESKADTNNESFPAQVTSATGATVTTSDLFARSLWSTDEATNTETTVESFETNPVFAEIWNCGYGSTGIQPIVCREGEGVSVYQSAAITGTPNLIDVGMEVTLATT